MSDFKFKLKKLKIANEYIDFVIYDPPPPSNHDVVAEHGDAVAHEHDAVGPRGGVVAVRGVVLARA